MISDVWGATTCPRPNWGESPTRLVTHLKYLEDASTDPGDTPHGVASTKLDIQSVRSDVKKELQRVRADMDVAAKYGSEMEQYSGCGRADR